MKKFSQFDLIRTAVVGGTGNVLNRLFESKYVQLEIVVPKYDFLRGQMLVSDVNDLLDEKDDKFTIDQLFGLLYKDFLRQIQQGTDIVALGQFILREIRDQHTEHTITKRDIKQLSPTHYVFEDRQVRKKRTENPLVVYPIRLLKKLVLRGEVLLYDLSDQFPDLHLTLEELIALRYRDVMKEVKAGNVNVFQAIVRNVMSENHDH